MITMKIAKSRLKNDDNTKALYQETYPILFDFILNKSKDTTAHDAQDIAQEAYLRLIRIRKKSIISHPKAYLFQIAANLINEHYARGGGRFNKLSVSMAIIKGWKRW